MLWELIFLLQGPCLWDAWYGVSSSPFSIPLVPFPFVVNLTRGLVPCCVYALPTLSDMAPSL